MNKINLAIVLSLIGILLGSISIGLIISQDETPKEKVVIKKLEDKIEDLILDQESKNDLSDCCGAEKDCIDEDGNRYCNSCKKVCYDEDRTMW